MDTKTTDSFNTKAINNIANEKRVIQAELAKLADEKSFHNSRLRVIESDVKRLLRNQQNLNKKLYDEQDKQMNQYLDQDSL